MEIIPILIISISVYVLVGLALLFPLIDRMSTGEVYAGIKHHPLIDLFGWPYILWFYTHKGTIERIAKAQHDKFPWVFDIKGKKYPKDMQDKLLRQHVEEKLGLSK